MSSVRLYGPFNQREIRTLAANMAFYTMDTLIGPVREIETWHKGLQAIGCLVVPVDTHVGFVSSFTPESRAMEYQLGDVHYNTAQPSEVQLHGLAHEYGHALLHRWVPEMLFGADVVYNYDDDARLVRHKVAKAFERMMVG